METKTIQEILSDIQKKINVPKSQKNTFGNYNYRSCEDIVEAVKKLLPDGVTIVLTDEIEHLGDRYYVKARAILARGIDDFVMTTAYAREALSKKGMDEAQITGSASSYARKYALNGLLLIDDTKDADTQDNTEKKEVKTAPAKPKKDARLDQIKELLQDLGYKVEGIKKKEIDDMLFPLTGSILDSKSYDDIINKLTIKIDEKDSNLDN